MAGLETGREASIIYEVLFEEQFVCQEPTYDV